ncbi:MAG TPA: ABC transporter substrate-binding protein [bacterium]|nr:ABC transporter substrate-binding protein [bacterium]
MRRFLRVFISIVLVSLLVVGIMPNAFTQKKYNEAPELVELVKQGELPPVEQRLPKEPLVLTPLEEIGQYGGTLHLLHLPSGYYPTKWRGYMREPLLIYSTPYLDKILPNVAKTWKVTGGGKVFTFFLREGMKWSDGYPFTADDIVFWYEDVIKNDELTPSKPAYLISGGKLAKVRKLSTYVVEFSFDEPTGLFLDAMCCNLPASPSHYLKQFHPKYTSADKLKELMKKGEYNNWRDLYLSKADNYLNPGCPTLDAFMSVTASKDPVFISKRNPYYWKVDSEGNQLPYIDRMEDGVIQNTETYLLKVLAGDVDYTVIADIGGLPNYSVIVENKSKGNYRLIPYIWPPNNIGSIFFNYGHTDPVIRNLFNDKRFRFALSFAINRDEINKLLFKGQAVPSQATFAPGPPYYGDFPLSKNYTQFDPVKANQLLDEMGLTKRDKDGYRLRPDGKELTLTLLVTTSWPLEDVEIAELCRKYWANIGIRVVNKPIAQEQLYASIWEEKYDLAMRALMLGGCTQPVLSRGELWPASRNWIVSPAWAKWLYSNGKEGTEPPQDIKKLKQLFDQALKEPNTKKRNNIILQALRLNLENIWAIGIVNEPEIGKQYIFKNYIRNVNRPGEPIPAELYSIPPCQFFIKK